MRSLKLYSSLNIITMIIENTCPTGLRKIKNRFNWKRKERLGNLYWHGNIILKTNIYNILYVDRILSQKMERQKNKNYGITILVKGISAFIPLTTAANNFPKSRLHNKTSRCNE